ncbi:MAG: hypothetical protein ACPLWB_02645 [Caldisericia bacterium]
MNHFNHYSGVIHIHTIYSKDSLFKPLDIMPYLKKYKINFAIITDHNSIEGKKYEGFHENILLLVGEEISPNKGNHLLAFNIKSLIKPDENVQSIIDEINLQNGLSFIEHPFFEGNRLLKNKINMKWTNWNVKDFTGIAIFNYTCDGGERLNVLKYLIFYFFPGLDKDKPNYKTINKWDELNKFRKTVGIGTLDLHFLYFKFLIFKIEVFPFKYFFNSIRTNIITDKMLNKETVYEEIKKGHVYISNNYLGDTKDFIFYIKRDNEKFIMGDELELKGNEKIIIKSPSKSLIKLIHNGKCIYQKIGKELILEKLNKGFYRVEIYKLHMFNYKPWIFSNPIYIR